MLLGKKEEEAIPPLLAKEIGLIDQINKEAYRRLGSRYLWYNKVRTAAKSGIHLFEDKSLEEQMEATRAALQMLGRNLDYGIGMAFNSTLESIKNSSFDEEGLPEKLEIPDRNSPPSVKEEGDALIISFMPIRFLSLGKVVRDKGKGIDFYSEGLVKKFYFKVLAFYCDPANWHPDRLGYMIAGLDDEAPIADISAKLAPLKTELELFAASFQMFKFGRQARGPKEAGQGNALDDTFEISNAELLADLYMQSFILSGMGHFLFRYFLTLITCTNNPRAYRLIANIFLPALAKSEEMRIRFQGSFTMEREKIRLRPVYQPYFKECEAKPVVETVKHKGVERRKLNYTHRLQEISAFVRVNKLPEKQAQQWQNYLKTHVLPHAESNRGMARLMEILHLVMRATQSSVNGKLEVVTALRSYAAEQDKLGLRQVSQKKKAVLDAKRKKIRTASKFRSSKQFDMVKVIEQEAAEIETHGEAEINKFTLALAKRKEALEERAEAMQATAVQEGEKNLGLSSAEIYRQFEAIDPEHKTHGAFVQFILQHIQEENDSGYHEFYKHLFTIVPGLAPTQKIVLRSALEGKIELGEDEMTVSPEETRAYEEQVDARVTELNIEAPGTLERRLMHGTVNTTVGKLMEVGLTLASLKLLLQMPVNMPNQPPVRLEGPVVNKLLILNQLKHPFPENDIILPNVEQTAPPLKRLNFNRLGKLL